MADRFALSDADSERRPAGIDEIRDLAMLDVLRGMFTELESLRPRGAEPLAVPGRNTPLERVAEGSLCSTPTGRLDADVHQDIQ